MFNWFGRKSAPARVGAPWFHTESETGFARSYEAQLDEVYRRNPVGLRAVRLVAEAVGGLAVDGDERGLVTSELLERVAAGLLLHGNAYVQLVADGHDRPAELHALRPERVSVVTGADGWPAAYLYRAGAQAVRIARTDALGRAQVAHVRSLDPGDDHYDPERDYQTGQMQASGGRRGARTERVELPAVLTGRQAKALVEEALSRRYRRADRIRFSLPPSRLALRPGDAVQLAGNSQPWVVRSVEIAGLSVDVDAEVAPADVPALPADPGRPVAEPDEPIGRTELILFEAPPTGGAPSDVPIAYVAAATAGAWKAVPLELRLGVEQLSPAAMRRRAIIGQALSVPEPRAPMTLDEVSSATIKLVGGASHC